MVSSQLPLLLLSAIITQSMPTDIRSMYTLAKRGWKFQCAQSTCLPVVTLAVSNTLTCLGRCLDLTQCTAATFHRSTSTCELFVDASVANMALLADTDTDTAIVMSEKRFPRVSTTTQSTTTSTTSTSTSTTTACLNNVITPAGRAPTIAWDFDDNLNDRFGVYNGTALNNPPFALGRNGCGKCLNLNKSLQQSVLVNVTPYIDLRSISFSVESWIKPTIVARDGIEHVIFGQCSQLATRRCMRASIGNPGAMSFLLYSDTLTDSLLVPVDVWSHVTFVYNLTATTMSLYLNGTLRTSTGSHGPLQVTPTALEIGNVALYNTLHFAGCIDDVSFYPFARTATEIASTVALG